MEREGDLRSERQMNTNLLAENAELFDDLYKGKTYFVPVGQKPKLETAKLAKVWWNHSKLLNVTDIKVEKTIAWHARKATEATNTNTALSAPATASANTK